MANEVYKNLAHSGVIKIKRDNDVYLCRTVDASGHDVVHLYNGFLGRVYVLTTEYNKAVETGNLIRVDATSPAGTPCTGGVMARAEAKFSKKGI